MRIVGETSLNGRPRQPMFDSTVNMAEVERTLRHQDFIVPLRHPFRVPRKPLPTLQRTE